MKKITINNRTYKVRGVSDSGDYVDMENANGEWHYLFRPEPYRTFTLHGSNYDTETNINNLEEAYER